MSAEPAAVEHSVAEPTTADHLSPAEYNAAMQAWVTKLAREYHEFDSGGAGSLLNYIMGALPQVQRASADSRPHTATRMLQEMVYSFCLGGVWNPNGHNERAIVRRLDDTVACLADIRLSLVDLKARIDPCVEALDATIECMKGLSDEQKELLSAVQQ